MIVSSVSPGTNSITMKKTFSCFSAVRMRDDVRVIEAGEQPRLAQQLAEVDALLVRDLERDLLVDPGVFGEVDGAEAAAADRREDLVLADDLSAEEHRAREYSSRMSLRTPSIARAGSTLVAYNPIRRAPVLRAALDPGDETVDAAARRGGAPDARAAARRRRHGGGVRRPRPRVPGARGRAPTGATCACSSCRASSRPPSRRSR